MLEELIGQKFVFGVEGPQATAEEKELFQSVRPSGLILFRRNLESPEALGRLVADLEQAARRKLRVLIDHEGGRVLHLPFGATVFPDAEAAAQAGRPEWVKEQGEIEAEELCRLGITWNLAPVLDVLGPEWNPAIGTRSYGRDPLLVGKFGKARIEGLQSKGVTACAKHWPGLGSAVLDPHRELPVVEKNWNQLRQTDLPPFRDAFEAGVGSVMSTHVVFPELESRTNCPVTFSRRLVGDTLRREFGFQGLVLTDDLNMGAISKRVSIQEAAPLAAKAGHDLLLVCRDRTAQREAFNALLWAAKKKEVKLREVEESVERIQKQGLPSVAWPRSQKEDGAAKGEALARKISGGAAILLKDGRGLIPFSSGSFLKEAAALFPDLKEIARERFVEPELLNPSDFIRKTFSTFKCPLASVHSIPLNPSEEEQKKIQGLLKAEETLFFFLWDAHLFEGARGLLGLLQRKSLRLVVILLREPRDFRWVSEKSACVTAYGYRKTQIEAAAGKIFSAS